MLFLNKQPTTPATAVASQHSGSINGSRIADKICNMLVASWAKKQMLKLRI